MTPRRTTACAYCSNPVPAGAATCPTCNAPAPPEPDHAAAPRATPPAQVVVGPGVPRPVASPQRWPGQSRPAGSGFGAAPPAASPPVQVFYSPPPQPRRGRAFIGIFVLLAIGAAGVAAFVTTRSTGGGLTDGPPQPIQLNQVVQGELTTFRTRSTYALTIAQPTQVMITASSTWDNYLEVHMGGQPLYQDDDSGGSRNALINAMLAPGNYTIVVRPFSSATGPFTLSVSGFSMAPASVAPYPYPGAPGMPQQGVQPVAPAIPVQ